jgi:diguanylate cyclase (GGDEF)-like protein
VLKGDRAIADVGAVCSQDQTGAPRDRPVLAGLVDRLPIGLVAFDANLKVLEANDAAARMLQYQPSDLVGRMGLDFVHPDDAPMLAESAGLVVDLPWRAFPASFRLLAADGAIVPVAGDFRVLNPPQGDTVFIAALSPDAVNVEVFEFLRSTVQGSDLSDCLRSIVRAIEATGHYLASVHWSLDDDGPQELVSSGPSLGPLLMNSTVRRALSDAAAATTSSSFTLGDLGLDPELLATIGERTFVNVFPIVALQRTVGILAIWARDVEFIGPVGNHFVRRMVDYAALAVTRTLLLNTLSTQASTDALTGIANRAAFMSHVSELLPHGPVGLAIVDVDGFKAINDTHGHPIGDEVLTLVAQRLRGCVPPQAMLARLGGDEFAFASSGEGACEAGAEECRQRIARAFSYPLHTSIGALPISVSVGFAAGSPNASLPELLATADGLMYAHKRSTSHAGKPTASPPQQSRQRA